MYSPMIGVCWFSSALNIVATESPMLNEISSPAYWIPEKRIPRPNPSRTPTRYFADNQNEKREELHIHNRWVLRDHRIEDERQERAESGFDLNGNTLMSKDRGYGNKGSDPGEDNKEEKKLCDVDFHTSTRQVWNLTVKAYGERHHKVDHPRQHQHDDDRHRNEFRDKCQCEFLY